MDLVDAPSLPVRADDLAECRAILSRGSKSFSAASMLLPARVRGPAAALYAFCREADDLVDEGGGDPAAIERLNARLDRIYAGVGLDHPVDRAFAGVIAASGLPRAVPDALIEGFAWDAAGRHYASIGDVRAYGVRVASTVGLATTWLMGVHDPQVLARACDLGVAMQLTNIARDVGEDARNGRIYLPSDWLAEVGLTPAEVLAGPRWDERLATVVGRLLDEAERLYRRADAGIPMLPWDCRPSIAAASRIYEDIGRIVRTPGYDPIARRAVTSGTRKLVLAIRAFAGCWRSRDAATLAEPPLPEAEPLITGLGRPGHR